ncbi:MAG: ATP-binding cassette domain-containing protein, partial [Dehalococcoidales bacterium]|nr:ATP-binding cassette domain-containing protein [Dehalococcoidales bacterium]
GEERKPENLKRVGVVMDSQGFYPNYSGRDNLRMFGSLHKPVDNKHVDEVLEMVGLANRAHSILESYSMGMKQRLSIALAILDDPELLIFDEPTNGMDPEGIAEIRDLISQLARQGKTVLLASHILAEVEQVCTHMAILKHGKVVKQGDMLKIMLEAGRSELELVVVDPQKAVAVLFDVGYNARIEDVMVVVTAHEGQAEHVSAVLAEHGLFIKEMRRRKANLESVFLEATGCNKNQ